MSRWNFVNLDWIADHLRLFGIAQSAYCLRIRHAMEVRGKDRVEVRHGISAGNEELLRVHHPDQDKEICLALVVGSGK